MSSNMKEKTKNLIIIVEGVLLVILAAVILFLVLRTPGEGQEESHSGESRRESEELSEESRESRKESEASDEESGESLQEESREESQEPDDRGESEGEESRNSSEESEEAAASGTSKVQNAAAGPLQVIGTDLCDSQGNPVQLRGVSTHGLAWFPDYVNETLFRELHEQWNANVVRLAMYTAESGGYCTGGDQEHLKQLIRDGVEYASDADMYVIIDWHILSDGDPNTYKEEAKEFFREMSAEFADRDNILYEICNEPNGGTSWSRVREYAGEVIPVIRENDEDAVILVGTPNWCQYVDQAAADPITEWDNIMYTLHFYAATHRDSLRQTMTVALDSGLPIFVSEYSICDASGNGGIDEAQAAAWVETMDSRGISYVAWSLSNKNETAALISSSCNKTSGLSGDDLSSTGKWLYGVLTGGQGTLQGSQSQGQPQGQQGNNQGSESREQSDSGQETPSRDNRQPGSSTASTGELNVTFQVVNSWESEGKYFYQCEVTVENISGASMDGWQADIEFNEVPRLSDSWNGVFTVEGNTLHITPADYNGQLEDGGIAENIGFIVSGSENLLP